MLGPGLGRPFYRLWRARAEARAAVQRAPIVAAKFETRLPDAANAIDIFAGRWASDLSTINPDWRSGGTEFGRDDRPALAARYLGVAERFDGMSVLELGPLEGIHAYQLAQLGAKPIVAIEANVEAFLKCLVVKEALGFDARFLLGDFTSYLERTSDRFDLVFCCGVLYHLENPLGVIRNIARVSSRCFVWTHYYDAANYPGAPLQRVAATVGGFAATYFRDEYRDREQATFWGGNRPSNSWMMRSEILDAFRHFGVNRVEIVHDDPQHPHGASFSFVASKPIA